MLQGNTSFISFCITRIISKLSSSLPTSCLVISSISALRMGFHMHLRLLAILYHATMFHSFFVQNSVFLLLPRPIPSLYVRETALSGFNYVFHDTFPPGLILLSLFSTLSYAYFHCYILTN